MRLKNFELAMEEFSGTAPEGAVQKRTAVSGIQDGDGGAFFTFRDMNDEDHDNSFFNITQITNANVLPGFLVYSGTLSGHTENAALEVVGHTLKITKNKK